MVKFPDLRINVHISVGPQSSFLQTGLSLAQAEAIIRRMVAIHNETIGPPFLVYVGITAEDLTEEGGLLTDRPPGIVVDSFSCTQAISQTPPCTQDQTACTAPGGNTAELVSKARVTFQPSSELCDGPGRLWGLEEEFGRDATRVLLHEFGHALGLNHDDLDPSECNGLSDGASASGVMGEILGAIRSYERDWRRDDIEGLRTIYGADLRYSIYTWADPSFPANPNEEDRQAVCAEIRTPPALSSAVAEAAITPTQVLGYTDKVDRVSHLVWNGTEFAPLIDTAIIDPSSSGVSFAPIGLAHSDADDPTARKVFVVWSADESKTAPSVRLRFGLRDIADDSWDFGYLDLPDGMTQGSNDVAVGFDPGNQLFIITSITDRANPYFLAVDLDGTQLATTVLGAVFQEPFVFDLGKANCFLDAGTSRCVVPYTSAAFDPNDPGFEVLRAGWFDLEVQADGSVLVVDDTLVSNFAPTGMVDLASGPDGFRGVVGDRRYGLARAVGIGATNTPTVDTQPFPAEDWPLRIGSQKPSPDVTTHRFASRRIGPRCGNGTMECDEECDDGNIDDNDGCSAQCALEPGGSDTNIPTTSLGTSEGGGGTSSTTDANTDSGGPPGDGCDCDVDARSRSLLGLLLFMFLHRRAKRGDVPAAHR